MGCDASALSRREVPCSARSQRRLPSPLIVGSTFSDWVRKALVGLVMHTVEKDPAARPHAMRLRLERSPLVALPRAGDPTPLGQTHWPLWHTCPMTCR